MELGVEQINWFFRSQFVDWRLFSQLNRKNENSFPPRSLAPCPIQLLGLSGKKIYRKKNDRRCTHICCRNIISIKTKTNSVIKTENNSSHHVIRIMAQLYNDFFCPHSCIQNTEFGIPRKCFLLAGGKLSNNKCVGDGRWKITRRNAVCCFDPDHYYQQFLSAFTRLKTR